MDYAIKIVQLFGGLATLITIVILILNFRRTKKSNDFIAIGELKKEEQQIRECISKCDEDIEKMNIFLKENPNLHREQFFKEFSKFENIRKIAYFYEYLGIMIHNKSLDFKIVFKLFSFPDEFWKKTACIRSFVINNVGISDFWQYFKFLEIKYSDARNKQYKKHFKLK